MTIARVKNWISEVLYSADLNAEFNNILTYLNASTIVFTKVGIGMTPSNILDITQTQNNTSAIKLLNSNTSASAIAQLWLANSATNALISLLGTGYGASGITRADGLLISSGQGAGGLTLNTGAAKPIYFGINGTEAARIEDTNGALLVGTSTMQSGRKLVVSSATAAVNVAAVHNTNATPGAAVMFNMNYTASTPDDNTALFMSCVDATTTRLIVYSDGDVLNHDGTFIAISSEELKQDIRDYDTPQWDDIKAIKLKKFRFKDDVKTKGDDAPELLSVIAEEVEKTSPGLVKTVMWNGAPTKAFKLSILPLKMLKALQETMERVEALETKTK